MNETVIQDGTIYSVSFDIYTSLVKAKDAEAAKNFMRMEHGNIAGPYKADLATEEDINYVISMRGYVIDIMPKEVK